MEFLITLAEAGKGMIRKQTEFGRLVIPLSFTLLCDGVDEDDREWRAQESEMDEVDGEENAAMGMESAGATGGSAGWQDLRRNSHPAHPVAPQQHFMGAATCGAVCDVSYDRVPAGGSGAAGADTGHTDATVSA